MSSTPSPSNLMEAGVNLTIPLGDDPIPIETTPATSSTSSINQTQKSIEELLYNVTGYYIDDEKDSGYNEFQTLVLALLGTFVCLVITLITGCGIRILWVKYKRRKKKAKYGGMQREGTGDSLGGPLHSHLLNDKSCTDSNLVISTEDVGVCSSMGNNQHKSNNHSNTNGSIITMTLKNNHLIVETEERNDLEEDSRETTMKYSPGARDGVFVVEVQQGVRRSPGSASDKDFSVSTSDQCALVHSPPDRYCDETPDQDKDAPPKPQKLAQVQTGLAQSNTSLTNTSYSYSTQHGYDNGCFGYPAYSGYVNEEPLKRLPDVDDNRPIIMAALYKDPHKNDGSWWGRTESLDVNGLDEVLQEEQHRLGNGKVVQNDISTTTLGVIEAEPEVRSGDYENEGFEKSNDLAKS